MSILFAIRVCEVHLPTADNGRHPGKITRHRPVERNIGEGSLRAPAAWRIDAVDERLDALLDFFITQIIDFTNGAR